ncbi:hypothetical protein OSB04_013664 [Centaurea solstitialis]|uniref:DUF4378 domain-containing protein n=1 Tax=Centaurea solstitialis TaxID=347529 RepID=A0AA38TDP6_9ASTR|nr:hypothetical protein OSB04_013664 [Centaurea solstitialis]
MGRNKKHLHELLTEDQEPFHLQNFIADRRSQLKSTVTATATTAVATTTKRNPKSIINHVCLFSFHDSPDFKKSPFLDFPARDAAGSPFTNPKNAAVFLHIPARTAAMLLDAATRIHNQNPTRKKPGSSKPKIKPGFGLFGSFLRRLSLKDRSSTRIDKKIRPGGGKTGPGRKKKTEVETSCSSADWSEKSSELETSCSSRSIEEIERENDCYCENPMSPFRFSLERSPSSPTRRRPEFPSPVASPSRRFQEDKENYDGEHPKEIHVVKKTKRKNSVVQYLYLTLCSMTMRKNMMVGPRNKMVTIWNVATQALKVRAKHQLLQKLQRFERLAGLDPIELEKHMLDCYGEDDDEDIIEDEEEMTNEEYVKEIFNHLGVGKIPWYMKKLVYDLITEENKNNEPQVLVQRVCKRLHSWKVVELNTIDMMVETDFGSEGWKRCDEEKIKETGMDLEASIFGFLVEELVQELVSSSDNVIFTK